MLTTPEQDYRQEAGNTVPFTSPVVPTALQYNLQEPL